MLFKTDIAFLYDKHLRRPHSGVALYQNHLVYNVRGSFFVFAPHGIDFGAFKTFLLFFRSLIYLEINELRIVLFDDLMTHRIIIHRTENELAQPSYCSRNLFLVYAERRNAGLIDEIADIRRYASNASHAKAKVAYTAYNNDILNFSADLVVELNKEYGLRFYSYSDYHPAFLLENMQMYTDAAVKGLKGLAYTKDIDYAKIFEPTGANINISTKAIDKPVRWDSLTASQQEEYSYLTPVNGMVYMPDGMQGADWKESIALRQKSIDNGTGISVIMVCTSDAQVEWAMKQEWCDVIIPYHVVFSQAIKDTFLWKNYKAWQEDKKIKGKWKEGVNAKHITPIMHGNDLNAYLQALEENNLTPRFEKWLKSDPENYMKLVNETRRSYKDTQALQPIFNMEEARKVGDKLEKGRGYDWFGHYLSENEDVAEDFVDRYNAGERYNASVGGFTDKETADLDHDYAVAIDTLNSDTATKAAKKKAQKYLDNIQAQYGFNEAVEYDRNGNPVALSKRIAGKANINASTSHKFSIELSDDEIDEIVSTRNGVDGQLEKMVNRRLKRREFINFGKASEIMKDLGVNDIPFVAKQEHIRDAMTEPKDTEKHHHAITQTQIADIVYYIHDPAMVIDSGQRNDSIIIVTDMEDPDGSPIIASVQVIGGYGYIDLKQTETNTITSVHGRDLFDPFIANALADDRILYVSKEKSQDLLQKLGVKTAKGVSELDFDTIIHKSRNVVNTSQRNSTEDSEYAPTFYSKMANEIDAIKTQKIGAASVVSYLKGKGVKDEEIKWSGIATFLEGKKSVTKEELQEFAKGSQLQIEEKTLSDDIIDDYLSHHWMGDQKFDDYNDFKKKMKDKAVDEGFQRREVKFKQDGDEWYAYVVDPLDDGEIEIGYAYTPEPYDIDRDGTPGLTRWSEYKTPGGSNYREILFKIPGSTYSNQAMNVHWGEKGVLAHARIQDIDTPSGKTLFVDEIQSDWHNAGEKEGYADKESLSKISEELASLYLENWNGATYREWQDAIKALNDFNESEYTPFLKEITEKYLSVNNFDFPSEVTEKARVLGEKQRELENDLESKKKSYAEAEKKNGEINKRIRDLERKLKSSDSAPDAPFRNGTYVNFVLKYLLRKAAEEGYDSIAWTTGKMQEERWSNEFAEGYRIEYDQDIPKFLNKYGKQWGAKVEDISLFGIEPSEFYALKADVSKMVGLISKNSGVVFDAVDEYVVGNNDYALVISEKRAVDNYIKKAGLEEKIKKYWDSIGKANIYVHSMKVTDSMKESVLYKGQQLYSREDSEYMELAKDPEKNEYRLDQMVGHAAFNAGYKQMMFHETSADNIHVFDISRGDHSATDSETPYGIFTKSRDNNIGIGDRQMKLYVKAENTLNVASREYVSKYIPDLVPYYDEIKRLDDKYGDLAEKAMDSEMELLEAWSDAHPEADMEELLPLDYIIENKPAKIDDAEYLAAHKHYEDVMAEWTKASDAVRVKCKDIITDYLRDNGYDSMYLFVDAGSNGRQTDALIVLDENQVKSANTVTYDDNGNVIPLSERFNSGSNDIRFSIDESFLDQVDEWNANGRDDGTVFTLGTTGNTLQALGAIENDIYMNSEKVNRILKDHPEMDVETIKLIPKIIDDPTLILNSKNTVRNPTRVVMFSSVKDTNGIPVLAVLDLRPVENGFVVDDMQKLTSAYGNNVNAVDFVKNSEVLFAKEKRIASLLRTIGFTMPMELKDNNPYVGSISYKGQNVNIRGKAFEDVFAQTQRNSTEDSDGNALTAEQQRFFKDSKIRDENGNVIPLSERFNEKSDDIRFSREDIAPEHIEELDNEGVTYGIHIRNDGRIHYASMIANGEKFLETRENTKLDKHIGERVALVETSSGKARVVGYATIGKRHDFNTYKEFRDAYDQHLVPEGPKSKFDMKDKPKYGYEMLDVKKVDPWDAPAWDWDNDNFQARNLRGTGTKFSLEDYGYHAGDLGKAESYAQQGYYRGTGHFGKMLDADERLNESAVEFLKDNGLSDDFSLNFVSKNVERFIDYLRRDLSLNSRDVTNVLESCGYEGVSEVINGQGQYVVFEPEFAKSADTVTYDDNGNVIPLSERFNSGSNDIRYSTAEKEFRSNFGESNREVDLGVKGLSKSDSDLVKAHIASLAMNNPHITHGGKYGRTNDANNYYLFKISDNGGILLNRIISVDNFNARNEVVYESLIETGGENASEYGDKQRGYIADDSVFGDGRTLQDSLKVVAAQLKGVEPGSDGRSGEIDYTKLNKQVSPFVSGPYNKDGSFTNDALDTFANAGIPLDDPYTDYVEAYEMYSRFSQESTSNAEQDMPDTSR